MNFLSVLDNVPNEPRVNNSIKTSRHAEIPPFTNKETIFVIERGSDIVSARFQGP